MSTERPADLWIIWQRFRAEPPNAEGAALDAVHARVPHLLPPRVREALDVDRRDAWALVVRMCTGGVDFHDDLDRLVSKRVTQLRDADLAGYSVRKPTPAIRRELDAIGAATDADLMEHVVPAGERVSARVRPPDSTRIPLAWHAKLSADDHAALAAAHAKLSAMVRESCGGRLRGVFGAAPPSEFLDPRPVTFDVSLEDDRVLVADSSGRLFDIGPDGTVRERGRRFGFEASASALRAVLAWARDPDITHRAAVEHGVCGACGETLPPGSRDAGFGRWCAGAFADLVAPLPPAAAPADPWTVLRAASSTLRNLPCYDDSDRGLPGCVLDHCREVVGADVDLDAVAEIVARGVTVGWNDTYVPADLVAPAAVLADYLGVPCSEMLEIVAAGARFDLTPKIRLALRDLFPPPTCK